MDLPGRGIHESLGVLGGIIRILHRNGNELLTWLGRTDDPAVLLPLWEVGSRYEFHHHLDESERLLYNFAAAVSSRVDYYRALIHRGHLPEGIADEYEQRVRALADDPHHAWLTGVRSYMVHHRLPSPFAKLSFDDGGANVSDALLVPTARLLESGDFNAVAKTWMRSTVDVDVRAVVVDYLSKVDQFDGWFGSAYVEQHADALDAFITARDEAKRRLLGGSDHPTT
jgi:hypothetical protein